MKTITICVLSILFIAIHFITCAPNPTETEEVVVESVEEPVELATDSLDLSEFPKFPLPPPQPSATDEIPKTYFSGSQTLSDVNKKLTSALEKCGYTRKSYFYVPNGFALVTQLEKINTDGTPKPDSERWRGDNHREFSLKNYLKDLLYAQPGFYRCIVFVVTDKYYKYSDTLATRQQTQDWLISGTNRLPSEIGALTLNDGHSFDVLIYEFKKNENDQESNIIIPSAMNGKIHLTRSKVYDHLKE